MTTILVRNLIIKAPSTAEMVQFEAPQPPRKFCTMLFEIRSI
jgi:hypothetical protein